MDINDQFYKYVIVDGQAYTKEKILIYTILATTTNKEITLEDVLNYFNGFGEILNARLLKSYNFSIKFADPKDAAKVLEQTEHKILNYKIDVEPDSCWHQRGIEGFVKYIQEREDILPATDDNISTELDNGDNDEDAGILKLNDFSLESICKYLPIHDQINFALTCPRFCDIFEMFSRVNYTNLNMNQGFKHVNSFQINCFGLIVGPYIESLQYSFESLSLAKLLGIYCTYLKTLRIYCLPMTLYILGSHAENNILLKTVELVDVNLNDRMMHYIQKMKNLKFLSLACNRISGESLSSLVKLKGLSLNRCMSLHSTHYKDIFQNLKNLKYLDIRMCHGLGPEDYQCILQNLTEIEILKFTIMNNSYNHLARLPKLKNLEINTFLNSELSHEFLQELVKHQGEQMENLKFYSIFNITFDKIALISEFKNLKVFWCCHNGTLDDKCLEKLSQLHELENINLLSSEYVTNYGVLKMLQNCVKVKKLHLVHCEKLTSDLIRSAYTLLQDQHEKCLRNDCLHMTMEDEKSFRDVIEELGLKNSNPMLKISFESSKNGCVYCSPTFPEGLDVLEDDDDIDYEGEENNDEINVSDFDVDIIDDID